MGQVLRAGQAGRGPAGAGVSGQPDRRGLYQPDRYREHPAAHPGKGDLDMAIKDYIRERFFPHMWCPGCGHGMVLNACCGPSTICRLNKNDIVMVSGIGCSSRISGYLDFHTLHTLHGRALAFATGVKLSRPELNLIVPMGDGDALAIGGNHFIHAARRNIDMTAIVMNNRIYGMTGGQYSPLSGYGISAPPPLTAISTRALTSWSWQRPQAPPLWRAHHLSCPADQPRSSRRQSFTRAFRWWRSCPSAPPISAARTRKAEPSR